jgi:RNA exonuclease 4
MSSDQDSLLPQPRTKLTLGCPLSKSTGPLILTNANLLFSIEIGRYVALDCEMVGVGPHPDRESALARVSIVNYNGDQVYDSYVLPLETITDYRTHVSGISPKHMKVARPLKEVQADVVKILEDRVVIGHSIKHDLAALMLSHPLRDVRDTSRHPPYRKIAGGSYPKLKILASELLGTVIQEGEHSSVEDARACMMLFRKDKAAFEREHSKRWPTQAPAQTQQDADAPTKPRKHKKKKKKH